MITVDKLSIRNDLLPEIEQGHRNLFYVFKNMQADQDYLSDKFYLICSTYVYGQLGIKRLHDVLDIPDEEMLNHQEDIDQALQSIKNYFAFVKNLNETYNICLTMQ